MSTKLPVSKYLASVIFLVFVNSGWVLAQNATNNNNSPYSRFALGDIQRNGFAPNSAMGGTGFAMTSPFYINVLNPASYTNLLLTGFEAGAFSKGMISTSGTTEQKTNNTSVSYLALAFPVTKWWGASAGILPFSRVAYRISDYDSLQNIGGVDYIYSGNGGMNQLYFGNGFKPLKNLSIGFNLSYLFGSINHSQKAIFEDSKFFNTRGNDQTRISDIYMKYGIQYSLKINDSYKLNAGAVYSNNSTIRAFNSHLAEQFKFSATGKEVPTDTLINTLEEKGDITLPAYYGIGLALLKDNKWIFTGDFAFQPWKNYTAFGNNDTLSNSTDISVGAQYIPDNTSVNKFFKQVQYRVGFRYSQSYLQLRETQLNDYAVTFGFGIPIRRERSTINLSVELGKRGTTNHNLIEEKYGKITIGMTLNDKWFIKSKID